jgi:hypothetical protein
MTSPLTVLADRLAEFIYETARRQGPTFGFVSQEQAWADVPELQRLLIIEVAGKVLAFARELLPTREELARAGWNASQQEMYPKNPEPWDKWNTTTDGREWRAVADAILRDLRERLGERG